MSVGFLFDNDGVLIDSHEFHWRAWELLMQEEPAFKMTLAEFEKGFGKRNDLILREAIPSSTDEERRRWAARKEELFRSCARGRVQLIEGMEPFLAELKDRGVPRIIASSTPPENLEMFLESTVLGEYFDTFVSAEQVAHGKPAPDIFLAAAKALSKQPRECIVLEDAPAGIESGKAAGCFVVGLATTHKAAALAACDLLFATPHELNLQEILKAYTFWAK